MGDAQIPLNPPLRKGDFAVGVVFTALLVGIVDLRPSHSESREGLPTAWPLAMWRKQPIPHALASALKWCSR